MKRDPTLKRPSLLTRLFVLLSLVALLASCKADSFTGVELQIIFSNLSVDQVVVRTPDGTQMGTFPTEPREITSGETVVLLFPNDEVQTVEFRVDALFDGNVVGSGASDPVTLMPNSVVPVSVRIGAPDVCGDGVILGSGCDDGNTANDDGCSASCEVENGWLCSGVPSVCVNACPDGCGIGQRCTQGGCVCDELSCEGGCCDEQGVCQPGDTAAVCGLNGGACSSCAGDDECTNGICGQCARECDSGCCNGSECNIPTVSACGTGGEACLPCDTTSADNCSASGDCACGDGDPCVGGQRCVLGQCICDAESCPTCCDENNACVTRPSEDQCGAGGNSCFECGPRANTCSGTGSCGCGVGPSCEQGQICDSVGDCVCTTESCPDGCCDGDVCRRGNSLSSCGDGGGACNTCDVSANRCVDGACECGSSGNACDAGLACVDGTCECNADSCDGCCSSDGRCIPLGDTVAAQCGSGGTECRACDSGACTNGVCDTCASNCPTGCCDGETCVVDSVVACGTGAVACVACSANLADTCDAGSCVCGSTGGMCADNQRCVGGVCICNSESCPNGCCDNNECKELADSACGTDGVACQVCDGLSPDCNAAGVCGCGGTGIACGAGQVCNEQGECQCDASTCDGCCSGTTCVPFTAQNCGATCGMCGSTGDSCNAQGDCRCNGGPACGTGQRCGANGCVCDDVSCPSGCCDGNVCRVGTSDAACGTGGAACAPCLDGCDNGACPTCTQTCSTGCCASDTCVPTPTAQQCGTSGAACQSCGLGADSCVGGSCMCGTGPACGTGLVCVTGQCVCTQTSCSDGCCSTYAPGGECVVNTNEDACGSGGEVCVTCDRMVANVCDATGSCACGANPACTPPDICSGSSCTAVGNPGGI